VRFPSCWHTCLIQILLERYTWFWCALDWLPPDCFTDTYSRLTLPTAVGPCNSRPHGWFSLLRAASLPLSVLLFSSRLPHLLPRQYAPPPLFVPYLGQCLRAAHAHFITPQLPLALPAAPAAALVALFTVNDAATYAGLPPYPAILYRLPCVYVTLRGCPR